MNKLKGKVAVITGASKGIGAAIAKQLAADGAQVVVNYASSREGAQKVVSDITNSGGKAVAIGGNVANEAEIESLFQETTKLFGKVDILVNNAGIYSFSPLEQVTAEDYKRQYDTNVFGPPANYEGGSAAFPGRRWECSEHQLSRQYLCASCGFRLFIDESGSGYYHQIVGEGTGVAQDSCKRC
jgi:3-oxoacyl-[acyl-carrier protein] reductase